MERIQALIDKLYKQKQENCNPGQMLLTVQMLQSELLKLQQKNGSLGTAKVAVTLPVNLNFTEEVIRPFKIDISEKEDKTIPVPEEPQPEISQPVPRHSYEPNE